MRTLFNAYLCDEPRIAWDALRGWYRTPLGQELVDSELKLLARILPNLFGYYLLQVGRPADHDWLASSRIARRFVLDMTADGTPPANAERSLALPHMLPVKSDYLDVVLLTHALEFSPAPHQVLREAERVLIPEGHVVILGFNPWGMWGWRRLICGARRRPPWCGQFLSASRVKDWLALLGFDTVFARGVFYRPPLHSRGVLERLRFLERLSERGPLLPAAGYVLVAKKRVATLTPIRPRWRPRRSLVADGLVKPSLNRNSYDE